MRPAINSRTLGNVLIVPLHTSEIPPQLPHKPYLVDILSLALLKSRYGFSGELFKIEDNSWKKLSPLTFIQNMFNDELQK